MVNFLRRKRIISKKTLNRKHNHSGTCKLETNFEMEIPASSGGEGKNMKYIRFLWPLLEAALSLLVFRFLKIF
jgi:hypothetical protein